MKTLKQYSSFALVSMLFLLSIFAVGCGSGDSTTAPATTPVVTPTVIPTSPINGATGVTLNSNVTATPDVPLDGSTVTTSTFKLMNGTTAVAGVVTYVSGVMMFNPNTDLAASTVYTATITTDVNESNGTALLDANMTWNFTTGVALDTTKPTVISTNPDANETGVPLDRSVSAVFSEALDPATVDGTSFKLVITSSSVAVAGAVSYANKTMTFNPTADFSASIEYTATITTAVKDLAGNTLAVDKVWNFTSGLAVAPAQLPVALGTAGTFAILGKTAVSTTGTTHITGDVGVSPAAQSYITGFSETLVGTYATSPLVTGRLYAADMTAPTPTNMTTSISNMETAYTDAAGRTTPDFTELYAGDISGKILVPGLYKWGTGVLITSAGVTITGSATDVWIFQIAQDLTVANGAIVTLAGGALAKNIFWQVAGGTGVTIGTTANFKGVVLAQKAIVVNNGAIINGRLLSQTAVTLDANAVTQPAP